MPTKNAPPFRARIKKLRAALGSHEVDAILVINPPDIRYLTGFHGEDSWLVVSGRSTVILSDFRFQEELADVEGARVVIRTGPIDRAAVDLLDRFNHVAVQAEHMTISLRQRLARLVGSRRLRNTTGVLTKLRIIKDASEVAIIRKAVRIQEKALLATLETVAPGQSEQDICAELECHMKKFGAASVSFESIVAAQTNGSLPHYTPGRMRTKANQPLLIDWGARVGGYCSDMTRTIAFGRWPKKLAEVYEIVLEAQQAAIDAIEPGKSCAVIDAVAREIITKAGYGDAFGHGLGHGIGLDIHEAPGVNKQSEIVLAPGMVITVEPGIYLPGIGGVRIEDDVLVTERGRRNLCSLPKSLEWSTR